MALGLAPMPRLLPGQVAPGKAGFPPGSSGCLRPALWLCLLLWGAVATGQSQLVTLQAATNRVGKYEKLEFLLQFPGNYTNPYDPDEVEVSVHLAAPGGQSLTVPAFYCQDYERRRPNAGDRSQDWVYPRGDPVWRARFAPLQPGEYSAVGVVKDHGGTRSSPALRFTCGPSANRGFVRVSRQDPRFLEFAEGQPFFALGQNLAFIGNQQYVSLAKAEAIFGKLAENGANYVRIWTCCEDWAIAVEARKSAWGRSWDWRPPIVPAPGSPGRGRKCIKVPGNGTALKVEPSHPVALRPGVRYVISGKLRTEGGAALKLEGSRLKAAPAFASGPEGGWRSFQWEFDTGPGDFWLGELGLRAEGAGTAWVSDLSLRERTGGPELLWEAEVNRPIRGFYNPLDCFLVDEILAAAEQRGIYVQLCLLTRDLYMSALKDPASAAYDRAIQDARKFFRYAVARWGYSTSVAAWEYWNEMDPGLPTERFYSALGDYLEQADVYHHLRTTSTWGPSAKDCRHPQLDFADTHFYLRPSDQGRLADEVEAVLERTRWLRAQAPHKPAHLGEFGLADEKWGLREEQKQSPELVDFHNALWASALSGASGTAMFWWWERLDQREAYATYRPLSRFLAEVPWTGGELRPVAAMCSDPRLRVVGLQARDRAWLWLFDPEASWAKVAVEKRLPAPITKAGLELKNLPGGTYRIRWSDTRQGGLVAEQQVPLLDGVLHLAVPDFSRDSPCSISPQRGLSSPP